MAALPGLEAAKDQLNEVFAVLEAQQTRRDAGLSVRRLAWKNLVFAGGPGTGKSRAAIVVGQIYRKLGVLGTGHVIETATADLVGTSPGETGKLVAEALRPASGGILLVNAAHDWQRLPDHGQQVLRRLYEQLTEYRGERRDEIAVILAGQAAPLRSLLHGSPSLAARFRAVIDFPGYTPEQLTEIFGNLAEEAGLTLPPAAESKAAAVLAQAVGDHDFGNARLAVRLMNQAIGLQALRVAAASERDPAALDTLSKADIPGQMDSVAIPEDEVWPGQYLLPGRRTVTAGLGRACTPWTSRRVRTVPHVTFRQPPASSRGGVAACTRGPLTVRAGLPAAFSCGSRLFQA